MPESGMNWNRAIGPTLAWIAVAAVILVGGSRVHFDVNPVRLLPQNLPEVQGLTAFLDHFSRSDELILTIDGENLREVDEASRSLAARLRSRTDVASEVIDRPPGEEDPEGMAELIAWLLVNQKPEQLDQLAANLGPGKSRERIEKSIETMTFDISPAAALLGSYDAFGLVPAAFGGADGPAGMASGGPQFGSADGRLRLIYVWAAKPLARSDYLKLIAWTKEVREIVQDWQDETPAGANVRIRLTGEPAIMGEVSGSMQRDLSSSGTSTALFVALIFWGVYRKIRPLLALLALLTLVILVTFGLSGLFIRDLNVMNVGFASILIGLTDYGILIYQQSLVTPGDAKRIRESIQPGILCAATTTAASFAALLFS
ncbi:MAG: MMPL family transporter, partial [Verrucomicrobiales bacterium]